MLGTLKRSTRLDWVVNERRTTISYLGTREQAKADCAAADMQIDGNETSNTSPVRSGGSSMGAAPLSGTKEFTTARTRHTDTMVKGMRREFPTEGVSKKSGL